ncbi:MAG TPA: phytoene desaturase family protein [Chitinophagaceae bacterium]|nr:phytoene desaturase family protein [Chitinophagaceae bacterium]HPH32841.1 phytoene desaturase family protein [Chitinophagaceae bacterium]HPN57610.1 phytoene desaturase family protein [Chitinophagaceae bacterium]
MSEKSVIVIGSGFAGLSSASFMAKAGWKVIVLEKNNTPGGRACQLKEQGFTFDMGPSFYWMPDVFERYFNQFGKKVSDYYKLTRLDPSYRVYWSDGYTDLPADYKALREVFESLEPGSGVMLDKYLREAAYKYEVGVNKLVYKPSQSLTEFMDWQTISGVFRLEVFTSIKKHIYKYFKHSRLRQLMEFPVLFLGALPQDTPALYSLMNYADIKGGTWYPEGGMYAIVDGMYRLALELGVEFRFDEAVSKIEISGTSAKKVITSKGTYTADAVISGADYQFTETKLLAPEYRSYSDRYWDKKVMAPSCLMYYVGLNKKLKSPVHHALFFDVPFDQHGVEIYKDPKWPTEPLFYVSVSSATDPSVAPEGQENIVFLVPVASGLEQDTEALREKYFQIIARRMEKHLGESILDSVVYKKTFSVSDFVKEYNSFRGNAYGLANTLMQTAIFRPSCQSKKVKNLFYTGQLTVPGPGVPPSLISGEVVAKQVIRTIK